MPSEASDRDEVSSLIEVRLRVNWHQSVAECRRREFAKRLCSVDNSVIITRRARPQSEGGLARGACRGFPLVQYTPLSMTHSEMIREDEEQLFV